MIGKRAACKACGTMISIPDLSTPPAPPVTLNALFEEADQAASNPFESAAPERQRVDSGNSLTLSNEAKASNPGLLRMNILKFVQCYPLELLLSMLGGAIGIVLVIAFGKNELPLPATIGICALMFVGVPIYALYKRRDQLWHGCICPAIVIAKDPYLIAVYTDLSKGEGRYPAIKVVRQPLEKMTGGPPEIGTRLATVAVYSNSPDTVPHWSDFDPLVANCATTNVEEIQRMVRSIEEVEWQFLDYGVSQLPKNPKPGPKILLK